MLWRNTKECAVSENSCSKNFINFQEKHPGEIAFLNKVEGYLTFTGNVVLGNLWNFQRRFHKKHPRMLASVISCRWKCFNQKIFFKKYLMPFDIQWHVLPGITCITEVWRPEVWRHDVYHHVYLVCSVHSSSCLIHLDKRQHHEHCLNYIHSYFF